MLEPLATTDHIDVEPLHVIAVVIVAMVIGLIGVAIRRALLWMTQDLGELSGEVGEHVARKALDRRSMPTPWYCDRCRSQNSAAATHCYSCGARRVEAEAPVPTAEAPAGPSAGQNHRTRARN